MTELAGEIYGHYRLDEAIGEGVFGTTYRATDQRDARTVALKLLRAELCADEDILGRLRANAPRLIALDSPQLVPFEAWGEVDNRVYFVSPLLATETLRGQLDAGSGWRERPLHENLALLAQVASGVDDLHRVGIVHGDLRPENLFIQRADASGERLLVADYGLRPLVADRYLLGDPAFIAPEQLAGHPADRRGDIYALGVILYVTLSGAQPFVATSFGDALALHETLPPVPPRTLRPELPAVAEAIILRCLARDPDARYVSVAALAADLRALADELRPASADTAPVMPSPRAPIRGLTLRAAESTDLTLMPGEPQTVGLILSNEGTAATTARLTLDGAPSGWGALSDETLALGPGASEQITLMIAVARDAHNSAGEYPVTVRAAIEGGDGDDATLPMLWVVRQFAEGSLRVQQTAEHADGTATYAITIANLGNAPVRRTISYSGPEGIVGTIAPETVDLDPHSEASGTLTVSAPRPRLGRARRLSFVVEAASSSAETLRAAGEYRERPRLPLWLPLAAALILLLAGAGAATYVVAPATFAGLFSPTTAPSAPGVAQELPTAASPDEPTPTNAPPIGVPATGRATATSAPLTFSTTRLNFGTVALGGNAVQNIQVRNTSARALTFGSIQIAGANAGDFSRAGPCGLDRLDVGLTCPLTVIFSPTGGGTRTARLTVSLADGTTQTIELSGVAAARPSGTPSIAAPTRPVPPLAGARANGAAALLNDGRRMLIAGGRTGANTLKSVEIYDLATNTWSGGRDLSEARAGHTATLLPEGRVVVLGGRNGAETLKTAEEYDSATQSWSPFPALTTAREGHTTTLLVDSRTRGYRLLVLGGRNGGGVLDSGEIYDSNTRTWTELPRFLAGGRVGQTATLLKATGQELPRLLIVGGTTANGEPAGAQLYDPLGGGFSEIAGEPPELIARTDYTATLIEATGQVVFVGGASGLESVGTVTVYDPAAPPESAWRTTTTALLNPRAGHTATLLPYGRLLIVGGRTGARETANTEFVDPARLATPTP